MNIPRYTLNADTARSFRARVEGLANYDPYEAGRRSLPADLLSAFGEGLSSDALADLTGLQAGNTRRPFLVAGLPLDSHLPDTPLDCLRSPDKASYVTEAVLSAISTVAICNIFSFHNEKRAERFHQVCPVPGAAAEKSSRGSSSFAFHIEGPHASHPADALVLLCLRNREEARTTFASIDSAVAAMKLEERRALFRPEFRLSMGPVYADRGSVRLAVAEHGTNGPRYRIGFEEMQGLTPRAVNALHALRSNLRNVGSAVVLRPGEALVIPNRSVAHGREGFDAVFDGGQRWLQRAYLTNDLLSGRRPPGEFSDHWPYVWDGGLVTGLAE
jgi:L-asparagine oxygenase